MAYEDWLARTSAPLITAVAATPGLSKEDSGRLTGLAWLSSKHKELISLNDEDSQAAFDRLDRKHQTALEEVFGTQKYNPEDVGFWGTVKNYAGSAIGALGSAVTNYSEQLGRPVRALAIMDDYESFSDAWDAASNGERLFDADREEALRGEYGNTVANIAKKFAAGYQLSDIILKATTDEQFDVIGKFLSGDQTMRNALRDFNDAKISAGRAFAHWLMLDPNIGETSQGIEGAAYKWVSGSVDLVYDIASDPMTWLAAPVSALNKATFSIAQIMRAEASIQYGAGSLSRVQKLTKAFGRAPGIEGAFQNKTVRKLFDDVGVNVKKLTDATTDVERAKARMAIQDVNPIFDDNFIDELARGKAYNADAAMKHFKNIDALQNVVKGRVGSDSLILPHSGYTLYTRKRLGELTRKVSGYSKAEIQTDKFIKSGIVDDIAAAQSPSIAKSFKDLRNYRQRATRVLDRALIDNAIYTGGMIGGNSARNASAGTVYTIARTVFDKPTARLMSQMFVAAKSEADARNIVKGLYLTIADAFGATATNGGRREVEKLITNMTSGQFSEGKAVFGKLAKLHGVPDGTVLDASLVVMPDGTKQSLANATYQLSHTMHAPQFLDILKIRNEHANDFRTMMMKPRSWQQVGTDWWSAMNLLPRLGLRSVLDEALFNYLTVPVNVAREALKGTQASYTERMLLGKPGFKDVGFFARHALRPIMLKNVSADDIAKAMKDDDFAANLLEKQLTESLLGKVNFAGARGKRFAGYAAEIVRTGEYRNIRSLSEGVNKAVATSGVTNKEFAGRTIDLSEGLRKAAREHKIHFTGHPTVYTVTNNTPIEFRINAMAQIINRVDRNGVIGQLAVQYIDDPEKAVKAIAAALRKNNGALYKRFDSSAVINDPEKDAVRFFSHVHNVLTDDAGNVNKMLIDKMRTTADDGTVSFTATKLTLDDMDEMAHLLPSKIFGYANSVEVYENFGNLMNAMIETGFSIADRQVSTLSRTPAAYMYAMSFREKFAPVEQAFIKKMQRQNPKMPLKEIQDLAAAKYTRLSNDMALNRVLGFIDNPHVRSNLAFSARNVARYYRANEDFYRRAYRAASPEAVLRLRLAGNGLDSAGFIHEDENGDKYFSIPADEILYNAYAVTIGKLVGVESVRRPMPMALTGKIKMLTPSLDPESNLPAFASPFMSLGWNVLQRILPEELLPESVRAPLTKSMFGKYATNTSIWDQITPSAIKRVMNGLNVLGLADEKVASVAMQAGVYYAANGKAPGEDATEDEVDEFKYDLKVTARNILFIQNLIGLIAPVSPQLSQTNDIPDFLQDSDVVPLKREFTRLLTKQIDSGDTDAWNTALRKFSKIRPGALVYTVSETERDTIAPLRYTQQAADWMKSNNGLVSRYRGAAVFLAPQVNKFDMEAYSFLKREGFIPDKSLDQYITDIRAITVTNEYYSTREEYDTKIQNAPSAEWARRLSVEKEQALAEYSARHPKLKGIMEGRTGNLEKKKDIVVSMKNMLASELAPTGKASNTIRRMLAIYDTTAVALQGITASTDAAAALKTRTQEDAHARLQRLADGDVNARLFYDTILKSLIG